MKKTSIVCTMGPACMSVDILEEMMRAGMNIARMNLAHGDLEDHAQRIATVRSVASKLKLPIAIMLDIKGPEIRTGLLEAPSYLLKSGEFLTLQPNKLLATRNGFPSLMTWRRMLK